MKKTSFIKTFILDYWPLAAVWTIMMLALLLLMASCSPRVIRVDQYDYVKVKSNWSTDYIRKDQLPLWNAGVAVMHYQAYWIRMPKVGNGRVAGK